MDDKTKNKKLDYDNIRKDREKIKRKEREMKNKNMGITPKMKSEMRRKAEIEGLLKAAGML